LFVDVLSILSQTGNTVVDQIRQNLASTGTNATGRTSASLRFEVIDQTDTQILRIIGKPFFKVVETGRKDTPQYTKPSKEFVEDIKQWCIARGIEEKAAYGIAISIHQKGTKLFRSGGREDIFSNVITDDFVSDLSKSILSQFTNEYLKNVVKITSSGNAN
jgi:hypothetical protein